MKITNHKKLNRVAMGAFALMFMLTAVVVPQVSAAKFRFAVSPMNQKIVLNPGDKYEGAFSIANPGTSESDVEYEVTLENFYVDEDYNTIHEEYGSTGEILDWITITSPTHGTISPNDSDKITFTIDVPETAAGGGQYASFTVVADQAGENGGGEAGEADSDSSSTMINEEMSIAHLIFVDVTGDTVRQGEITDVNVPSFLLSGDITGASTIRNTGNVHGDAKYTLQIFPLFSDEEVYSNEETPGEKTILPDRTLYNETAWEGTPEVGIFNVVYTVEFEGVTEQVSKMVIKCPIWLLFIIFFVIAAIIIWIVMRARGRKKSSKRQISEAEKE